MKTLIWANSLIIMSLTSSIILNIMVESKHKCFANILIFSEIIIADHRRCGRDLRKEIIVIVNFWFFVFRHRF